MKNIIDGAGNYRRLILYFILLFSVDISITGYIKFISIFYIDNFSILSAFVKYFNYLFRIFLLYFLLLLTSRFTLIIEPIVLENEYLVVYDSITFKSKYIFDILSILYKDKNIIEIVKKILAVENSLSTGSF